MVDSHVNQRVVNVDEAPDTAMVIVKLSALFILGVIIISNVGGVASNSHDSATITLTANPLDGDIVTLDDHVFEFDTGDGVVAGHITVAIGTTLTDTMQNLATAVEAANYQVI